MTMVGHFIEGELSSGLDGRSNSGMHSQRNKNFYSAHNTSAEKYKERNSLKRVQISMKKG
jgi:hypothetical protein